MVEISSLCDYCDTLLEPSQVDDYCPNGLQVEGERPVQRLMTGVTACQRLVDAAVAWGADALLVHHGYFWRGEAQPLVGMKGRRIRTLMRAGISLLAYHLPLDVHPEVGNNRCLGDRLGLVEPEPVAGHNGLLWRARLANPCDGQAFGRWVTSVLGREPLHVPAHARRIATVAWCSGGGHAYIEQAAMAGADAYVSGEMSEQTTHQARELGLDYFAAGHHATERYGVQALGARLAEQFGLEHRFVDVSNPA